MGKSALLCVPTLWLIAAPAWTQEKPETKTPAPAAAPQSPANSSGLAIAPADAVNRVIGYTAWDDDYLYLAVQINKPVLQGKNDKPFSNPLEDDAVLISLQTDNDHAVTKRTKNTVTVAVSAVGGAQIYLGTDKMPLFAGFADIQARLAKIREQEKEPVRQQEQSAALLAKILKFGVAPKGASRGAGQNMSGYTVEVAIPWADLGGKPDAGKRMGICVAAQSIAPGSPPVQSLAARVHIPADLDNPALWDEILFSNAPAPTTSGRLICPRVFATKPLIDGDISSGEWNGLSLFGFGEKATGNGANAVLEHTLAARMRPAFQPQPPRALVPLPEPRDLAPLPKHVAQAVSKTLLAVYTYSYQADPRKSAPAQGVTRPDGATLLTHHPYDGVGPWFSYDRADWHRRQLSDLRRAGIDVALPLYRGAPRDRQNYADKGLTVMVEALQSLRASNQEYPQIGLYLDTGGLAETLGGPVDLREPAAQNALYEMVCDFYRRLPAAFRYSVPLAAASGGRNAYPVFLSDFGAFKEWDDNAIALIRRRFAQDFDADLLIVGASGFKPKAALDAYFAPSDAKGPGFDDGGWIKIATVGAGHVSTEAEAGQAIKERRLGDVYRADWRAALPKRPDWVLVENWNNFADGSEVAPSLEEGYVTADVTREYSRLFTGLTRRNARWLTDDVPAVMQSNQTYAVHARLQNSGIEIWGAVAGQTPVGVGYRWLRGKEVVASGALTALNGAITPGQNTNVTLPIAASSSGTALPDGDYTLEIGVAEAAKRNANGGWLADGTAVLQRAVKIVSAPTESLPVYAATLTRSDLSPMLETGSVYTVNATLRNDGYVTWRKVDGARATLRLYRIQPTDPAGGQPASETPVSAADASVELSADVPPGAETAVRVTLPLLDPDGKPLPVWSREDLWTYAVRWEIGLDKATVVGTRTVAIGSATVQTTPGAVTAPAPLVITDMDFGGRFTADATLATLPANRRLPMRLSVRNNGPQTWKRDEVRIGYHWYYADGTEFLWENENTPLAQDVAPGDSASDILVSVTAPPTDGIYRLVWDVKVGDTWASTLDATHAFDLSVRQVTVINGGVTFADLSKSFNLDGVTEADNLTDGDFDGKGDTFPASQTPPYAFGDIVPSTSWLPALKTGPDSPRRISFRWGAKDAKSNNFVACRGQRIELGKSGAQCRVLHLLAASSGKEVIDNIKLIFQEPSGFSEDLYPLRISPWTSPLHGEEIGFLARGHHDRKGLQPGAVALYHYTLVIREPRKLAALQLPDAPELKIAALTMEK